MTNEEKAKMIAEQCKPCSADFYSGIEQGVLLALNAEKIAIEKAEKWDLLGEKIAKCYHEYDDDGNELETEKPEDDLCTIGELAAIAYGLL